MAEDDGRDRLGPRARLGDHAGGTAFARDVEPRQDNWSRTAVPQRSSREGVGFGRLAQPVRPDGEDELTRRRGDAAGGGPESRHAATGEGPGAGAPVWGEDAQARAERERPFRFDGPRAEGHDHAATLPDGHTRAQSGAAVADRAEAATEAQSGDLAAPGEAVNVDVAETNDAAAGAAGAVAGQALNMADAEEARRAPAARGYHGGDGLFGDRRAEVLPTDARSRLARLAFWLREQPGLFDARGLAAGGQPRHALAMHVDEQHQEHVFLYSNIGPGLVAKPVPLGVWSAWDLVAAPSNPHRDVLARMLGHADPVHAARAHYLRRRELWAAHGARYWLAGVATAYAPPEPETARRLLQPLNDHLGDVDAPFLVEAQGPLVEPDGGSVHPLQQAAPALYVRLRDVLASPWADEARGLALGWVASIVEESGAEDREPFAALVRAIRAGATISPTALEALRQDGRLVAAQTQRNLEHAMGVPEHERQQSDLLGYLLHHRALVALAALDHWQRPHEDDGHAPVLDIAYLAAKARQDDPGFAAQMIHQLPDPQQSRWKPR